MRYQHLNPAKLPDWSKLFSQVVVTQAGGFRFVAVSGQVGVSADASVEGCGDFRAQLSQSFRNLGHALEAAGSRYSEIVKLTIFVVGYTREHSDLIAANLAEHFGSAPRPALSLLGVASLGRPEFLVEVEALAIGSTLRGRRLPGTDLKRTQ